MYTKKQIEAVVRIKHGIDVVVREVGSDFIVIVDPGTPERIIRVDIPADMQLTDLASLVAEHATGYVLEIDADPRNADWLRHTERRNR